MIPKCFSCGEDLIWQNDYDTEDIGQEDSEYLIAVSYTHLTLPTNREV